jgi:hypothetical protein
MDNPKQPDPMTTAQAQSQMNKDTAITGQELNMVNQVTPYGSLTYNQSGMSASGTPQYTATQSLSPENQQLYDSYMGMAGKLGNIGNTQADAVAGTLGQPFDFDASQANKLVDMQRTFLDPQWARHQETRESDLLNRGLNMGSEAYTRAMGDFSNQRQQAYDQNYLSSYKTAADMAMAERNQPLNELSALMSGSQVQQPGFTNTPQTQVSGVDYAGLVNQNYQNEMSANNAKLGGIFGLGSAALGGWGMGGFKMPKFGAA